MTLALALTSLTFVAGPSRAAEDGREVPTTADPGVTAPQLDLPRTEHFDLSLEQALLYTLQHNVSIVVQRYDHRKPPCWTSISNAATTTST